MPTSTELTAPALRLRQAQVTGLDGEISGQLAFFRAELTQLSENVLAAVVETAPAYAGFIRQIMLAKLRAYSPAAECVLAE